MTGRLTKDIKLLRFLAYLLLATPAACSNFVSEEEPNRRTDIVRRSSVPPGFALSTSPMPIDRVPQLLSGQLASRTITDHSEYFWALAHCQCARTQVYEHLRRTATETGALPQVMTPTVRQEIANNPQLRTLDSLGGLGDILKGIFASDNKIAQTVRDGLGERMQAALPGGSNLVTRIPFHFDFFVPVVPGQGQRNQQGSATVRVTDLASHWSLLWSLSPMWQNQSSGVEPDHGLQLLHTARTLAEWQYVYGLEARAAQQGGGVYGGLTVGLSDLPGGSLGAYDPRTDSQQQSRFFSGNYQVSYQDSGSVDMATRLQEQWAREAGEASLNEQSKLSYAMARAFERMRPENRGAMASLFGPAGSSGMFPSESHQLALIHLSALSAVVANGLVNPDTREVLEVIGNEQHKKPASLLTLARFARAMALWAEQSQDVSGAQIDNETAQRLMAGSPELRKAARAMIQKIMAEHMRTGVEGAPLDALALVVEKNSLRTPPLGEAAEVLATLVELEARYFNSPLLQERLYYLLQWFGGVYLSQYEKLGDELSAPALLWTAKLLKELSQRSQVGSRIPWAAPLSEAFQRGISDWGGDTW